MSPKLEKFYKELWGLRRTAWGLALLMNEAALPLHVAYHASLNHLGQSKQQGKPRVYFLSIPLGNSMQVAVLNSKALIGFQQYCKAKKKTKLPYLQACFEVASIRAGLSLQRPEYWIKEA